MILSITGDILVTNTVTDFIAMMRRFAITRDNTITVSDAGYLDTPIADRLFTGKDPDGRVFVNLPLAVTDSTSGVVMYDRRCQVRTDTAITVFQRRAEDDNLFITGGGPESIDDHAFLGTQFNDLSRLEQLLAGETVRFYPIPCIAETTVTDQDHWIEISLKR